MRQMRMTARRTLAAPVWRSSGGRLLLLVLLLSLTACDLFGGGSATPTPAPPTRQAAPSATKGGAPPSTSTAAPAAATPGTTGTGDATPTAPPLADDPSPTAPAVAGGAAPTPTPPEADTAGGPLLSLAVNGGRGAGMLAGWPLLARVGLLHPALAEDVLPPPLVLGVPGGGWADAMRVLITDERGAAQTWPLHLAQTITGPLTLDAITGGELVWWLSPDETAQIGPGLYTAVAVLDTRGRTGGWQGRVTSMPVSIQIAAAPATLSPAEESEQYILLAGYALWRDDPPQALAHLDTLLAKQPDNIEALAFKGDLRDEAGAPAEGLQLYDQAIDAFLAQNPGGDPPVDLLLRRRELRARLINGP